MSSRSPSLRDAFERLCAGETVELRPRGHSMTGLVNDADVVKLAPAGSVRLELGDAVLVRVKGSVMLHKVIALDAPRSRVRIGNNRGGVNGWTPRSNVAGIVTHVNGSPRRSAVVRVGAARP